MCCLPPDTYRRSSAACCGIAVIAVLPSCLGRLDLARTPVLLTEYASCDRTAARSLRPSDGVWLLRWSASTSPCSAATRRCGPRPASHRRRSHAAARLRVEAAMTMLSLHWPTGMPSTQPQTIFETQMRLSASQERRPTSCPLTAAAAYAAAWMTRRCGRRLLCSATRCGIRSEASCARQCSAQLIQQCRVRQSMMDCGSYGRGRISGIRADRDYVDRWLCSSNAMSEEHYMLKNRNHLSFEPSLCRLHALLSHSRLRCRYDSGQRHFSSAEHSACWILYNEMSRHTQQHDWP